jgi:hypothetical protein
MHGLKEWIRHFSLTIHPSLTGHVEISAVVCGDYCMEYPSLFSPHLKPLRRFDSSLISTLVVKNAGHIFWRILIPVIFNAQGVPTAQMRYQRMALLYGFGNSITE